MFTFYILLSMFLYSVAAGATYKVIKSHHPKAIESAFFGPLFWPVTLGLWGGILLTSTIGSPAERIQARQAREIEEANHRVKLAKLQAQENAELDRMLK